MRWLLLPTIAALGVVLVGGTVVAAPVDSIPADTVADGSPGDTVPAGGEDTDVGEAVDQPVGDVVVPLAGQAPGDLVVVPAGCASADPALAVFTGTLMTRSADAGRFAIGQVRAGSLDEFRVGDLIDVRYGDDVRYLAPGEEYLIGVESPAAGLLASKVRAPAALFGGDAVIGINDSDVSCPRIEDPVMTLRIDGTAVDVGVLTPLDGARNRLLRAVLIPVAVTLAGLALLASIKLLGQAAFRSVLHDTPNEPPRRRRHRTSAQ